jgi:hypothetical protein
VFPSSLGLSFGILTLVSLADDTSELAQLSATLPGPNLHFFSELLQSLSIERRRLGDGKFNVYTDGVTRLDFGKAGMLEV